MFAPSVCVCVSVCLSVCLSVCRRGLSLLRLQLLAVLGGQFRVGDEICGLVLSVRYQEDILSIWNRSADSRKVCMQIRDTLRSTMGLPEGATMEYKKHTDSMRDNSSYRNTNANF